jgi:hypothetical protein
MKEQVRRKIRSLIALDRKIKDLPALSTIEKATAEREQAFESVYHSNKLEGNKLTKREAQRAILLE